MRSRAAKQERHAPAGSFRTAMRAINPELAARLDAIPDRRAEPEPLELEMQEAPSPPRPRLVVPADAFDLEADAIEAIEKALKARGWGYERMTTAAAHLPSGQFATLGKPGRPDVYVYPGNGIVVFLEAKSRTGTPSEKQLRFQARARDRGYVCEVVFTPTQAIAAVERAIARNPA